MEGYAIPLSKEKDGKGEFYLNQKGEVYLTAAQIADRTGKLNGEVVRACIGARELLLPHRIDVGDGPPENAYPLNVLAEAGIIGSASVNTEAPGYGRKGTKQDEAGPRKKRGEKTYHKLSIKNNDPELYLRTRDMAKLFGIDVAYLRTICSNAFKDYPGEIDRKDLGEGSTFGHATYGYRLTGRLADILIEVYNRQKWTKTEKKPRPVQRQEHPGDENVIPLQAKRKQEPSREEGEGLEAKVAYEEPQKRGMKKKSGNPMTDKMTFKGAMEYAIDILFTGQVEEDLFEVYKSGDKRRIPRKYRPAIEKIEEIVKRSFVDKKQSYVRGVVGILVARHRWDIWEMIIDSNEGRQGEAQDHETATREEDEGLARMIEEHGSITKGDPEEL